MSNDTVRIGEIGGGLPRSLKFLHQKLGVKAVGGFNLFETRDFRNDYGICILERCSQFLLENVPSGGVGTGLEDGPDPLLGVAQAQSAECFSNGRRVMAKVVHHGNAGDNTTDFHATFDAFKRVESGLNLFVGQAAVLGAGDDCQGVANVEFAHQVEVKFKAGDFKLAGGRTATDIEPVDAIVISQPETLDRTMIDVKQRREIGVIAIGQELASARHQVDKTLESGLDGGEVVKNVGVIELQIIDNDNFRKVMQEFAAFIEKSSVIFVAFENKPRTVGEARAFAKVVGNAADEKAGIQAVMLEDPRQEGSGRRFAVSARDDDGAFATEEKFLE